MRLSLIYNSLLESTLQWSPALHSSFTCTCGGNASNSLLLCVNLFFVSVATSTLLITYPRHGYELFGGKKSCLFPYRKLLISILVYSPLI